VVWNRSACFDVFKPLPDALDDLDFTFEVIGNRSSG
jgi:hypothetical protein